MTLAKSRTVDKQIRSHPLLSLLVAISSLLFSLSLLGLVAGSIQFRPDCYGDAVGHVTLFQNYSIGGNVIIYLLSVTVVPGLAVIIFAAWFPLSELMGRGGCIRKSRAPLLAGIPYAWLALPAIALGQNPYLFGIAVVAYVVSFPMVLGLGRPAGKRKELLKTTSFPMAHVVVLLSGVGLGLYLIARGTDPPLSPLHATWVCVRTAFLVWFAWKAGGVLFFRRSSGKRGLYLNLAAIACAPLSLLSLRTIFWLAVVKGETVEWTYNLVVCQRLLLLGAFLATFILNILAFYLVRTRVLTERAIRSWLKSTVVLLVIPVLLYAFIFKPSIHRRVDFYHDGEVLVPAMEVVVGKLPYKDVRFLHGLLFEPGRGILSMSLFGPTLKSLRIFNCLLYPLLWIILYFIGYAITGSWTWALVLAILGNFFARLPPQLLFINTPDFLPCVSLTFLLLYISSRRIIMVVSAGLLAGLTFLWVFNSGISAIMCGIIFFGFRLVLTKEPLERRWKDLGCYVGAAATPLVVMIGWAAWRGILTDFISFHVQVVRAYCIWFGHSFPSLFSHIKQPLYEMNPLRGVINFFSYPECGVAYLFILVILLTVFYLLLTLLHRSFGIVEWKILALLLFAMIFFVKTLIAARYYVFHATGEFPGLLCFAWWYFLIERIRRQKRLGKILPALFLLAAMIGVLLYYYFPAFIRTTRMVDVSLFPPYNSKNRLVAPKDYRRSSVPRLGNLWLPNRQAENLEEMLAYFNEHTSPSQTIFDFTSHPLYYFLLERNSPCQFTTTEHIATADQQRRTNRDLEEKQSPLVIFYGVGSFGPYRRVAWGSDFFSRQYLISEYIMKHYKPETRMGNLLLVSRGMAREIDESWKKAIFRFRDLYWLPFFWGEARDHQLRRFARRVVSLDKHGLCSSCRYLTASGRIIRNKMIGRRNGLLLERKGRRLRSPLMHLDPWDVTYLKIRASTTKAACLEISWKARGEKISCGGIRFYLRPDGQPHDYLIRLASFPEWTWSGPFVRSMEIKVVDSSAPVEILGVELLEWPEEIGI